MTIAIRPIPVLTGTITKRFETMAENSRHTAYTNTPKSVRGDIHSMQDCSCNVVLKKCPNNTW